MGRSWQRLGVVPLLAAAAVLFYAARDLPRVGDPDSPASTHVTPRYIEKAHEEAGAPNMVTAILADYRGYDTLGETIVILTAGLACLLVLGAFRDDRSGRASDAMVYAFGSDVLDVTSRVLFPFLVLFAIYVVIHGHTSPGGGFQAGAILAAALMLVRLVRGSAWGLGGNLEMLLAIACGGVGIYAGIGAANLFFERNFLDYSGLPLPFQGAHLREMGTLGVEIGVFFAVTAVLVLIFDCLTAGAND